MTQLVDIDLPADTGGWTRERGLALAILVAYVAVLAGAWFVLSPRIPNEITLSLFGKTKTIHDIPSRVLSDGGVLFAILPFALWVEAMSVGWANSSLRRMLTKPTASMRTDMALLVLGQGHVLDLVGKVMVLGASMISGGLVAGWLKSHTGFAVDPSRLPFLVQLVLFFYVYTFLDYWTHRIDHSRWFWPLHRYHHSAEDFCVVTTARQHPAAFVGIAVINIPLAVLGASPEVMIFVNMLVTTLGFVIHSQMNSDWGFVGRWIVQSPQHHRLHHKLDMTEKTGHFSIAPVWDRLFGTWYDNATKYPEIGVAKPYRHGAWVAPDLLRDYFEFWKGLVVPYRDPA
ncbi:MAG: sterol desaturase family protein [Alphaproteobacteria bacterium]